MSNKKIAFFDSGIGGLTVLYQAFEKLPNENYVYFADTDNVPYGTKSKKEIKSHVFKAVEFLTQFPLKALVLACNTATSVVIKDLRKKYDFPIIGMEPAIKPALEKYPNSRVLLCATKRTIKEKKLKNLIERLDSKQSIETLVLQKLVTFSENKDFDSPKLMNYLSNKFSTIDWTNVKTLVLGCTHFVYYKHIFKSFIPPQVDILDGNLGTIKRLKSIIESEKVENKKSVEYYQSRKKLDPEYYKYYLDYLASS